jgi:hypothetical protein
MRTVRFNGSFKKENVFRLEAGPEVDAAWKAIGSDCKFFIFISNQLLELIDILR